MDHADRTDDRSHTPLEDDRRREPSHGDDALRREPRPDDGDALRREPRHDDDGLRREPRGAASDDQREVHGGERRDDLAPANDDGGHVDRETLGAHAGVDVDGRWRATQARFLESPRDAVAAADELVTDVIEDVRRQLDTQRAQVADTWQRSDADTEDLRTAMLRYREVLDGLTRTG